MSKASPAWALVLATLLLSPVVALPVSDAEDVLVVESPADPATPSWTAADRLVVGYDAPETGAALARLVPAMGATILRVDTTLRFLVVETDPARQTDVAKALLRADGVLYAKPDVRAEGFFVPNDPRYGEQWGPAPIGMPSAWDAQLGNHSVVVAVIDTGVNGTHPDLAANFCVDGWDYVNGDASSMDDHGHGTHVAGTVAAAIDNGVGVAGMANACIMAVKVLDAYGSGYFSDVASSLVWAADNGADVVSMSLGGCPGCDPGSPTTEAMQYAHAAGVVIVAAAGNAYCDGVSYPAAYPEAIAVAALAPPGDARATFSSCGDKVELSAPGENILSTALASGPLSDPSGYMYLSGTSMATPHVSGVAALVLAHRPTLGNEELRCILAQTADDLATTGRDPGTGFGRVDAPAALTADCAPLPPYPGTLSARARNESVALSWTRATSFGTNVTGYNVYRSVFPSPFERVATLGNVLEYTDGNLTNNVTYTYAVSAVNAHGEGNLSNAVDATPYAPPPFACRDASDTFGNTCATAAYNFIDIRSTGTPVGSADDALFPLSLPFPVRFYGNEYWSVNVSTNGFLNFFDGTSSGCCSPMPIPSNETPNAFVAGVWADLYPVEVGSIVSAVVGLPGSRTAIVQFTDVPFYGWNAQARLTFQFQLHEGTSVIEVHYADADPLGEREYGAGIESCTGEDGIQGTMGMQALVETAVRYTPGTGAALACVPNTPPSVTITSPQDGATVSGTVDVAGTATDADAGGAVEYVQAYWQNETHGAYFDVTGTTNWTGSFSTAGLSGWYTISAYASDGSAYGWATPISVFVDGGGNESTTPHATIRSPRDGQTVSGWTSVEGIASDPDGDPVDSVTVQVDAQPPVVADGTSNWSAWIDFSTVAPGWHVLRAQARGDDGAGPAHEISVYVEALGNTAPYASISTPWDHDVVGRFAYVAGTAWDNDLNDSVEAVYVSVDGGEEFLASGTSSWDVVLDMAPYGEGMHTIQARATDGESFGPPASVVVFVDLPDGDGDLAVTEDDITVRRQRVQTDLGDAPNVVNERRVVEVTVRNLGTVASGGWVDVYVEGETDTLLGRPIQHLGSAYVVLAGGESVTFEYRWDTTLNAGDVTIVARVVAYDVNPENDEARKASWVRVGGVNAGVAL